MATARSLCVVAIVAAGLLASTPAPAADETCAAPETSLLPVPEWYVARCAGETAAADPSRQGVAGSVGPAGLAVYKTMFPAPNGFWIGQLPAPNPPPVPNSQPIFAMGFHIEGRLFAIDNTSRQLGIVDYWSGIFTPVAAIHPDPGPAFTVTGLAYDTTGGTAYVVASDGAPAGSRLFRLDLATAALTPVGTITNMPFVIDIAFDHAGQLWAHDIGADTLIQVNKATAAPTIIGPTGMSANFAQGMMFDYSGNTLYGCAYVTAPAPQGQLVEFSRATGAATVVAGPVPHEMECAVQHPSGPCAPRFSGLATASTAGTSTCAIQLTWPAGSPCPSTTLKYNVYRSTTPGTPPSPATLLSSCLTTLSYTDTDVVSGTRYYYRVRVEDSLTSGNGPCNGGRVDDNIVERSAAPTGPPTTDLDDVESGGGNWDTSGGTGGNPWTIVTTQSHSPTHSWFVADPATASDQLLRWIAPVNVPIGGGELSFWHAYVTHNSFDGHILEYSLDGGTTWSDILGGQGSLPANAIRFTLNGYDALIRPGAQSPLAGRQAWSGTIAGFRQVRLDLGDFAGQTVSFRFRFASDGSGAATGVWIDDVAFTVNAASCVAVPSQVVEAQGLAVDAGGNGVYQPNEAVVVAPSWRNVGSQAIALTGAMTNHTGPAGPTYTIPDAAASYGTIPVGGTASCTAAGNCYTVANTATSRPATHWDTTVEETVTPTATAKTWTLHVGNSFAEVPPTSPFLRFIETLLHRGVTGGCSQTNYCPGSSATRDQMAVFAILSKEPPGYLPPACVAGSEAFADVPATSPFCRWIEELARRSVVSGCGSGNYCPQSPVTREQMAIFVLRTLDPTLTPPPCAPPNLYLDVPEASPYCRWIEELTYRGVVSGCGGGNYCPTNPVTREQMGVFLAVTFGLTLYGL